MSQGCKHCVHTTPVLQQEFTNLCPVTLWCQGTNKEVTALVDTGARAANYVNRQTLDWLIANGADVIETASKKVCTAFNDCRKINQVVEITISFNN